MKILVNILYAEDCPHTPPTVELLREVARELRLEIELQQILIINSDQAKAHNYLGSPTIQVNGLDIDPRARSAEFSGFS